MRNVARFSKGYIVEIKDNKAHVILIDGKCEQWIEIPKDIEPQPNLKPGNVFAFVETDNGKYQFAELIVKDL